jgi:hypothetical protein
VGVDSREVKGESGVSARGSASKLTLAFADMLEAAWVWFAALAEALVTLVLLVVEFIVA